jgi:type I restriction enzyme R subunit
LDAIDLDSYRVEAKAQISIQLEDANVEVEPVLIGSAKGKGEPEIDVLTNILSTFNELFGNIEWKDTDNVRRQIAEIPAMVAKFRC